MKLTTNTLSIIAGALLILGIVVRMRSCGGAGGATTTSASSAGAAGSRHGRRRSPTA